VGVETFNYDQKVRSRSKNNFKFQKNTNW